MSSIEGIRTFGVVGAGQMGSGIAQVAATAGLAVVLNDREQGFLDRALKGIEGSLSKLAEKGEIPKETKDAALGRIKRDTAQSDLRHRTHDPRSTVFCFVLPFSVGSRTAAGAVFEPGASHR